LQQNQNNNVTRDKFCIVRTGDCQETLDLFTSKEMNSKIENEVNAFGSKENNSDNISNKGDMEKEIDEF